MSRIRLAFVLCFAMAAANAVAQTPPLPPAPGAPAPPAVPMPPGPEVVPAPPAPPSAPALPAPPRAPQPERAPRAGRDQPAERQAPGQPVNIRFDITIVDEGGAQASRKSVSLTVADRQSGQVRSAVFVPDVGQVPLAVDAMPSLERDGKIRARISLDYQPDPGQDRKQPTPVSMRLAFGLVLESGKRIVAAQAADPVTDRRVSVEVTATVLR
jgi:hypothetical protein